MSQYIWMEFPKSDWLTQNMRLNWAAKAPRTARIRDAARLAAQDVDRPHGPVLVTATAFYRGGRGLDSDACAPSVKACIDGFTDAGLWPDDDGDHVAGILYLRSRRKTDLVKGFHGILFSIVPWNKSRLIVELGK